MILQNFSKNYDNCDKPRDSDIFHPIIKKIYRRKTGGRQLTFDLFYDIIF